METNKNKSLNVYNLETEELISINGGSELSLSFTEWLGRECKITYYMVMIECSIRAAIFM